MEKEINIDDILKKHSCNEMRELEGEILKSAIKEIVTETLQMCADEAKVNSVHENDVRFDHFKGIRHLRQEPHIFYVDKESITSLINKIKF